MTDITTKSLAKSKVRHWANQVVDCLTSESFLFSRILELRLFCWAVLRGFLKVTHLYLIRLSATTSTLASIFRGFTV